MDSRKVNWIDMFPDEFYETQRLCPVCYMGYGLAEPHNQACALGVDWITTQLLLESAADKFGGIVAPPFAWHIQEQPYYDWETDCCSMGMSFSSSITEELFLHNMLFHIRNMDSKGFQAGILLSGHYLGELGRDMQLLCDFYIRHTGSPIRLYAAQTNELFGDAAEEEKVLGIRGRDSWHGGVAETAQLMVLKPEAVDLVRMNKPLHVPVNVAGGNDTYGPYCSPKGFFIDGRLPTVELGRRIIRERVNRIGMIKDRLLSEYAPNMKYKAPTIIDTEEMWARFLILTRKYWKCVQTRYEAENGVFPPAFPGWDELGE